MNAKPRIIPPDEIFPSMRHLRATRESKRCRQTIDLDGTTYRCGREHVDGIHEAFVEHRDGGAVRW